MTQKNEINIMPFLILLTVIFMVLKLSGAITWSWVWVTFPIWSVFVGPILFFLLFAFVYLIFVIVVSVVEIYRNIRR
jgi:hypothetical protein